MSRFLSRASLATAAVAIVVLCAQIADAQGGGGGGGGQGRRAGAGAQRGPGGRGLGGQSVVGLAGNATIQELVKISDAQKTKITEINTKLTEDRTAARGDGGAGGPGGFDPAVLEKMNALAAAADTKAAESLDEAQVTKILSALIQVSGGAAVNNAVLSKRLKVTDEQKKKLAEVTTAQRGNRGGGMRGQTPEERAAAQAERDKAYTDVLSKEQQADWAKIKDALKLTDEQLAGLRGGGPRGNRRGGGGGAGGGGGGGGAGGGGGM